MRTKEHPPQFVSGFYRIIIIKLVLRYLIIWKGFITLSPFGSSELIPLSFFLLKVSSELIFARHIVVQYLVLKKILTSSGTERGSICRRVPKWLVGQRSSSASAMLPCEPEAKGYFLTYIIAHDQRRLTEQIKFE